MLKTRKITDNYIEGVLFSKHFDSHLDAAKILKEAAKEDLGADLSIFETRAMVEDFFQKVDEGKILVPSSSIYMSSRIFDELDRVDVEKEGKVKTYEKIERKMGLKKLKEGSRNHTIFPKNSGEFLYIIDVYMIRKGVLPYETNAAL